MKRMIGLLGGLSIILLLIALPITLARRQVPQVRARLVEATEASTGFARAKGPRPLTFPADHGPHPDYQTEWWYYTGNLETADGRHFGYQLTFFRRALVPPALRQDRQSDWATNQVYMAHFALTDVVGQRHQAFERFARGAAGLAGAQAVPYRAWLEDWRVDEVEPHVVKVHATQDGVTIDLLLTDHKGPVLQGDRSYSQKGPEPGNASYYYSLTRLVSSGTVQVGNAVYQVAGLSWMDHEFSTSALAADQVGWDWFALQLDDGSELMVFQLRKADGSVDPFSSGTLIAPDGSVRHLSRNDFQVSVDATWRSPHSGATYPARWIMKVPLADLTLNVEPYLADQELNVAFTYWEGAVRLRGEHVGRAVTGSGYMELTGYASSMQGQF
jgi:predicted secreted hydrolase